jgi:hypothetical protein
VRNNFNAINIKEEKIEQAPNETKTNFSLSRPATRSERMRSTTQGFNNPKKKV